jgi:two-component system response regulator YesN
MYKVLLVDDERIVKLAIKSMIRWEELGLELAGTASNGISALQMIEKSRPDIIVTDIKMPGMDGVELIKKLKGSGFDGEILVLSNYNDFELVREALRYGAYDYVLKVTVKAEDFSKLLKEIIGKLDGKKGASREKAAAAVHGNAKRDQLLRRVLEPGKSDFSAEAAELSALCRIGPGDVLYALTLKASPGEPGQSVQKLADALQSIVEEFLAKSEWYSILEAGPDAALLAILYRRSNTAFTAESMAARLAELIGAYFNIRTGLVYSEPVSDYHQLFQFAGRCLRMSELFFYSELEGRVLPVAAGMTEEDACLNDAVKNGLDRVCEDFLAFRPEKVLEHFDRVIRQASEHLLNPYRLKKRLKKLIREVERKLLLNGYCSEEIFELYADDVDVISASENQAALRRNIADIVQRAQALIPSDRLNYRKEVREAVEYIERHASGRIALTDIARHVNLNGTYLCKVFKEDTGKSIVHYINGLKMKIAYGLLNKGDIMIKEAAAAVGIDDPFYFNRLFKKFYGVAPREIRNR